MEDIYIVPVAIEDLMELQSIGRQTFIETFGAVNTEENMKNYLEKGFSAAKLSAELTDPGSRFYFAKNKDKIAGYLKINFGNAQTEIKDDISLEIERIYVLKDFQGMKIGQLLFNKALEIAHKKNVNYVWLGVWEENPKAINFYKKNGFFEFDQHIFKLGDDEQTDIMMKLTLR